MKSTILIVLVVGAALAVSGSPARLRRVDAKSARQQQASDVEDYETKTPYPPAGFRPKIAFELPGERLPKALPAPRKATTTTTVAPPQADVEDVGIDSTETINDTTVATIVEEEMETELEAEVGEDSVVEGDTEVAGDSEVESDSEVEADSEVDPDLGVTVDSRTPANTYGAPDDSQAAVVVAVPSSDFQLPIFDAVRDFSATSGAVANVDGAAFADFPAFEPSAPSSGVANEEQLSAEEIDVESRQQPANTYGAPQREQLPADTYGVPELSSADNDFEEAVENELASSAEREIEALSSFADLRNGRLIFVPSDGSYLRQVYVTPVNSGNQRANRQSARLRQNSRLRQL